MSPRNNSAQAVPPPVMTWGKAFLPVGTAVLFDFLGFIFALFGIFGPLLAGVATKAGVTNVAGTSGVADVAGTVLGGAVTLGTGFFSGGLEAFGMIMAMVIGFFGWMTVGAMMLIKNIRIFRKTATALVFCSVLVLDEIPFVNIIPALSYRTIKMYRAQIKEDKKALAEYEATQKQQQLRQQQQEINQRNQRLAERKAANDEVFAQEEEQVAMEQEKMNAAAEQEALVARESANDEVGGIPQKLDEAA